MDKYLITRRSHNPITGPIMVTTSPRFTCPLACPLRKDGSTPTAGLCYAEHGALGGFIWTLLDRTPAGGAFQNGNIKVYGFDELLFMIRSLPPGALWRHNVAGDLPTSNKVTVDGAALRAITEANAGRRGFTFTHYDVLTNLANRAAIAEANANGFTVNLSADTLDEADLLADLRIGPVSVILPTGSDQNVKTPAGRTVVVCPINTHPGITCSTCGLCARRRSTITGFPASGRLRQKIT